MQIQRTNSTQSLNNETGHSHQVSFSNHTRNFRYAKQEHCRNWEGRRNKKPVGGLRPQKCKKRVHYFGHSYVMNILYIFFFLMCVPCQGIVGLLTWLKIHNFTPSHTES